MFLFELWLGVGEGDVIVEFLFMVDDEVVVVVEWFVECWVVYDVVGVVEGMRKLYIGVILF